jgi:cell fate regulator YaaT (PSP1 superfamily)
VTEAANFTRKALDATFASDKDKADIFVPEKEDETDAFAPDREDRDRPFAFAGADNGEFFDSESGNADRTVVFESRDNGGSIASDSMDDDYPSLARECRDEASAFPAVSRDGDPQSFPEDSEADRSGQARLLGVRLRKAGQLFFFPNDQISVCIGSKVIVECEQGTVFGEVASMHFCDAPAPGKIDDRQPSASILGLATAQDIALHAENRILADEAMAFCITCIRQRSLDMKLVDVEVLHDRSKIIFYFTAPARIDFRELVKDLVRNYRTRIELRQIGVRHEIQMVGGIGNCGMVCCCHQYLRKCAPVTIKMAKEQNLFLNPTKLSGMCGRLLCCLSFEQSNYEEFNRRCPKLGKRYVTEAGIFRILRVNMFPRCIVVCSDAGEEKELTLDEWESLMPRRVENPVPNTRTMPQARRAPGENGHKGRMAGREDASALRRQEPGGVQAAMSDPGPSSYAIPEDGGSPSVTQAALPEEEELLP